MPRRKASEMSTKELMAIRNKALRKKLEKKTPNAADEADLAKKRRAGINKFDSFIANFEQGATSGLSDEVRAAIKARASGKGFDEELRKQGAKLEDTQVANPLSAAAGEFAGSVFGTLIPGAVIGKGIKAVSKGKQFVEGMLRGSAFAAEGAAGAAARAKQGERLEAAKQGAIAGALAGPFVNANVNLVKRFAPKGQKIIKMMDDPETNRLSRSIERKREMIMAKAQQHLDDPVKMRIANAQLRELNDLFNKKSSEILERRPDLFSLYNTYKKNPGALPKAAFQAGFTGAASGAGAGFSVGSSFSGAFPEAGAAAFESGKEAAGDVLIKVGESIGN